MDHLNLSFLIAISQEVEPNVNMFGSGVHDRVLG